MKLLVLVPLLVVPAMSIQADDSGCHQAKHIEAAAHDVEERARHFDRVLVNFDGYGHISDDSLHLAEAAEHLHELAHANRSRCDHLRQDYGNVERLYNHFAREFRSAHDIHHNHHVAEDWYELEHAYHALVGSFDFETPTHGDNAQHEQVYYGRHGRPVSPELIAQWRRVCKSGRRKSCKKLNAVGAPLEP
ncbi:MAG: hypothetical protein O7E57_05165 [Gammaproteobacteria bacterium]|nr:hypothetical protein [Gammaproteobacteria bacterium]